MKSRYSGVLLHIASLSGPYGCGTMGVEAVDFLKKLKKAGFSYWQVLPLTIVDEFHSPYKSLSAFAGNPALIDPRGLVSDGLLTAAEAEACIYPQTASNMNYETAMATADKFLNLAFSRVTAKLRQHISSFITKESAWLTDYACFITAKRTFILLPWWEWPDKALAAHEPQAVADFMQKHQEEIDRCYFEQWVFNRQWSGLHKQARELGIGIIGDIPFYVDGDSADVWSHRELFAMESMKFTEVAGVPPDYFSPTGQLWGNPIYDWFAHQKENFAWWKLRMQHALEAFDKLRIDHFRALVTFWAIPYGSPDATSGEWRQAPYMEFYRQVFGNWPAERIFAEDLGDIDAKTREGIDAAGLANMKVLQFVFNIGGVKDDLPHNWEYPTVAYTGTHDNTTLIGWIWEMDDELRRYVLDYADFPADADWGKGGFNSPLVRRMLRVLWQSAAKLTVAQVQDLCGFGGDTRMNLPGRKENNWSYRLPFGTTEHIDWDYFAKLNKLYQRNTPADD